MKIQIENHLDVLINSVSLSDTTRALGVKQNSYLLIYVYTFVIFIVLCKKKKSFSAAMHNNIIYNRT